VTVDRIVDKNGWGHVGSLLQTICLLAAERGMATCLQEAWGTLGDTVPTDLSIPDTEVVWCGIALGYADPSQPVNSLRADREPLASVARFAGFPSQNESKSKL
jgi:nitroreductase